VALDTSEAALAKNENADEKIVGDIQAFSFPEHFDAIICWWVLEHIPRPKAAMARMAAALRPGGLLVVAVPYLWGLKAAATKLTPFSFHVWFARRSDPTAGTPGSAPYRTYLRRDIAPSRLVEIAAAEGLEAVYAETYSTRPEALLPRPTRALWSGIGWAVRVATLGRLNPLLSEYVVVFKKLDGPSDGA
jgi:SAM-dependent methyltransferase